MSLKLSLDFNPFVGLANTISGTSEIQPRMDAGYYGSTSYSNEISRDMWRSSPPRPPALEVYPRGGGYGGDFTASVDLGQPPAHSYRDSAQLKTEKESSGNLNFSDSLLSLKHNSHQSSGPYDNMTPPPPSSTLLHMSPLDQTHPAPGGPGGATSQPHPGTSYSPNINNSHCGLPSLSYHHQGNPSMTSPGHSGIFPSMSVNVSMSMNVQGVPPTLQGVPPTLQGVPPTLHGAPSSLQGQYEAPSQPTEWHTRIGSHNGAGYYPSPVPGDLFHPSHHTSYNPYGHHGYSSMYDSDTHLEKEPYYSYKQAATESVSRLYTLGTLNSRRGSVGGGVRGYEPVTGKVNLCRICGKTYARPSTLKTHMRTHSGEKPYKCQTCSKSFSQAANLTAHVRTHSGEKPFRCPVCDRKFSQSSSVTTHMRTHSGERPYRCRLCKKAFSDSSTLTKHLRIHSGEKPYQCKLCLLRFSQSGNLNRHMRVHTAQQQ